MTDSEWQDQTAVWSPSGARFAFARDSAGTWSIWVVDTDGANPHDVSTELSLPRVVGAPSFAPDDRHLAVVYPDTGSGRGAVVVVDLGSHVARPVAGTPPGLLRIPGLWSPDSRWLAYSVQTGDRRQLWVVATDGPGLPSLVAEVPATLMPRAWTSNARRYAAAVTLEPRVVTAGVGHGVRTVARSVALDGKHVDVLLRWSVGDTSIAGVDERGFVRGRRPGTTALVASAGGFRADTGAVIVTAAAIDTLLDEDWTLGLDTTRWMPFGFPRPVVVLDALSDGRPAFLSNGDYNHASGVVSTARFQVGDDGFTPWRPRRGSGSRVGTGRSGGWAWPRIHWRVTDLRSRPCRWPWVCRGLSPPRPCRSASA